VRSYFCYTSLPKLSLWAWPNGLPPLAEFEFGVAGLALGLATTLILTKMNLSITISRSILLVPFLPHCLWNILGGKVAMIDSDRLVGTPKTFLLLHDAGCFKCGNVCIPLVLTGFTLLRVTPNQRSFHIIKDTAATNSTGIPFTVPAA
jgi:hypothetical protein